MSRRTYCRSLLSRSLVDPLSTFECVFNFSYRFRTNHYFRGISRLPARFCISLAFTYAKNGRLFAVYLEYLRHFCPVFFSLFAKKNFSPKSSYSSPFCSFFLFFFF